MTTFTIEASYYTGATGEVEFPDDGDTDYETVVAEA